MGSTRDEIQTRMLSNIDDSYDKTEGSFFYDCTKTTAIELESIENKIDEAKSKLDINNLTGTELTQRVYERTGIERHLATYATTTVNVTGSQGAAINFSDKVSSDTINFIFQESKTVDSSGESSVLVKCELSGPIGNVPAGAIKSFPITLAGLTAVTNPAAVKNGYAEESDADLLERYYERLQIPATSNNKAHYKSWAKEVTGVGEVKMFPLWNGANTVKVVIIDSNKHPASSDLVAAVQNHIDPNSSGLGDGESSIGAYCTVESATGKTINVSFTASKDPAYTDGQRQANAETSIKDYLESIAFVESQVSYAKLSSAILSSKGILDLSSLLVNGGTANIPISQVLPTVESPVLGVVTIA